MTIEAAGAVVWRTDGDRLEVAVVHRPRYDDWSLPKGKLAGEESAREAACREVREETGHTGDLGPSLGEVRYDVLSAGRPEPKSVRFWALRATGGRFAANHETDELRWLPPAEALDLLSHEREREVVRRFLARLDAGGVA